MRLPSFPQFAKILYRIIPDGKNKIAFCMSLFFNALDEKDEEIIDNDSYAVWGHRFRGTRGIAEVAKKVVPLFQCEKFAAYIANHDERAKERIAEALEAYCPNITSDNASAECASLFFEILQDALAPSRDANVISAKCFVDDIDPVRVEKELSFVVRKLSKMNNAQVGELRLHALSIEDKIGKENGLLLENVRHRIRLYYYAVERLFALSGAKVGRNARFLHIALTISEVYQRYAKGKRDQNKIFEDIVDWLHGQIKGSSRTACETMVAFFIQNCEVFGELS